MDKKVLLQELLKYIDFPLKVEKGSLQSDFAIHGHDFNELVIIISGTASHQINEEIYTINAGDVCVLGHDVVHGFHQTKDLKLFNVMYDASQISLNTAELKQMHGFQALFALDKLYAKENIYKSRMKLTKNQLMAIEELLEQMSKEYLNGTLGFRTMLLSHFSNLVVMLCRFFEQGSNMADMRINRVADAVVFIEKNFTSALSIPQLSKMAHMSERHFNRVFSEAFAATPMEYIISLRLSHACNLLQKTDMSVTEVSQNCGFSDSNYFSKSFKKKYGVSPKKF